MPPISYLLWVNILIDRVEVPKDEEWLGCGQSFLNINSESRNLKKVWIGKEALR